MNKKNHKTTFGASLTALAFSAMLTSTAQAQTCTTVPSCSTLGYTKSASDCSGLDYLRCPFDQSKYFCTSSGSSSGGGYTPPAHEWQGTLEAYGSDCRAKCLSNYWAGTYTYEVTIRNPKCKLPTDTISFNTLTHTSQTFYSQEECESAVSDLEDQFIYMYVTVGVCNSLTDYKINL